MTTPLSQEVRAGLVAVAAPVKTPYAYTILAYEATVVALTEERDAALERVKALEAGLQEPTDEMVLAGCRTHYPALFKDGFEAKPSDGPQTIRRMLEIVGAARAILRDAGRALLTPKDPGHG